MGTENLWEDLFTSTRSILPTRSYQSLIHMHEIWNPPQVIRCMLDLLELKSPSLRRC